MVPLPQICAQINLKGPVAELGGGERGEKLQAFSLILSTLSVALNGKILAGLIILP